MQNKRIVKYARSRNQDYQLDTDVYRTYLDSHIYLFFLIFLIVFIICLFIFHKQGYTPIQLYSLFFSTSANLDLLQIVKAKIYFAFFLSSLSGILASIYLVTPTQRQVIKDFNSPRLVYDETAQAQFMQNEPAPYAIKITENFKLSERAAETGTLITGEPGSGKSVTLDKWHENNINDRSYSVVHDPKGDLTNKYLSAGESIAVIAPWLKETKAIDFGKLCYNKDINRQNSFIDLVIISFHGKPPEQGDTYWYDTSFAIYKAIFLRLCSVHKDQWQEKDICDDFFKRTTTKDFNELKEFYPPIGNLIKVDDKANDMVSAIIGSCIPTIIKFYTLASFWKDEKNRIDIKDFIYRKTKYQHIIIRNDSVYENIASCVIACFVNIATSILLDSEYLNFSKSLKNKEFRFLLDEFNSFAKFIDIGKFNGLSDLGRQAGIRLVICLQRRTQALHFTKNKDLADDFLATFPNLVICRLAQSDTQAIEKILGSYKVTEYIQSASFNASGQSTTEKANKTEVVNDVKILQNILGPIPKVGVTVCFKTVQNPIFAVVLIPFSDVFAKNIIESRKFIAKSKGKKFRAYKFGAIQKITDIETIDKVLKIAIEQVNKDTPPDEISKLVNDLDTVLQKEQPRAEKQAIEDPLGELGKEVITAVADPSHSLGLAQTMVDVAEALNPATKNEDTLTLDDKIKRIGRLK